MKSSVYSPNAPNPSGNYSQAIKSGSFVFLSGQLPMNAESKLIELNDPAEMYRLCFRNLGEVCKEAGGNLDNIVKLNVYFIDSYYSSFLDDVIPEFFSIPYPARIRLTVKEISRGSKIEVDAIMIL